MKWQARNAIQPDDYYKTSTNCMLLYFFDTKYFCKIQAHQIVLQIGTYKKLVLLIQIYKLYAVASVSAPLCVMCCLMRPNT